MKKFYLLTLVIATTLILIGCSSKTRLVLYIPNDYIDESLIEEFEKEHNVRVKKITFNSNEVALGQIPSNSYDVVVPSDYAIEELAHKGLIEKIDYTEFLGEGFEFTPQLQMFLDQLKSEGFNFLDYAVPYFWGSVGVLYKNSTVTLEMMQEQGFGIVANQNLNTVIYDSSRDGLMVGLLNVNDGVLLKDATQADVTAAEKWLISAKGSKTSTKSDQILNEMLNNDTRYDAVITYSGDAAYIMSENENYSFYIPNKTNLWADGFAIPTNAKQKDLAKEFIKFMTTHDSALTNTIEIGYSSPRSDVFTEMITGDGDYADERLKTAYESIVDEFQMFRHNDVLKDMISKSWDRYLAAK